MTSIFAPFFISAAEGTLIMSLVSGWVAGGAGGGGVVFVSSNSMSKIKTELGGMPGRPRSPYAKSDGMNNFHLEPTVIFLRASVHPWITAVTGNSAGWPRL